MFFSTRSLECIDLHGNEVACVGRLNFFYLGGTGDVLIVDHPEYPRWVADCQDPGQLHYYCVWGHGGVGKKPVEGDPDCGLDTSVERTPWGAIKAMFR